MTTSTRLSYVAGIDGLRAIAVTVVLLYHAGLSGTVFGFDLTFPGGFLGVEVFFVISGYLITSLLLAEWRSTSRVNLGNFWLRRARRLLPALFLLLGAVMAVSLLVPSLREDVVGLRGDVLSNIFYVTNWNFIFTEKSYFEAIGRPPLVRHLWSLAVEEQFYVVWPLLFTLGMAKLGKGRLLVCLLGGAVLSSILMYVLYDPEPGADPSRVFMGTDTRAAGLLIGCALAFVWPQWRLRRKVRAGAVAVLDLAGIGSLVGLFVLFLTMRELSPNLYRGQPDTGMLSGFMICSLLTAVAIAVTVHPAAHLGRLVGNRLFRWIGLRSYGIYLWHWPIFMLTRPGIDVQFDGLPLLIVRFGLTFLVAQLSFRFVEMPIRQGRLGRAIRDLRCADRDRRKQVALRLGTGTTAVVAAVTLLAVGAIAAEPVDKSYILNAGPGSELADKPPDEALNLAEQFANTVPVPEEPGTTGSEASTTVAAAPDGSGLFATTAPSTVATSPLPPPTTVNPLAGKKIVFLGDSVMLGAANAQVLKAYFPNAPVDASTSRQVGHGIQVLQTWAGAGWLAGVDILVIHLGTNGTFADYQFDQIMQILQGVPKVAFVNDRVPQRPWQDTNNAVIAAGVARYPGRAVLIDWYAASAGRPELFYDDGTHLRPEGAIFYAEVIKNGL